MIEGRNLAYRTICDLASHINKRLNTSPDNQTSVSLDPDLSPRLRSATVNDLSCLLSILIKWQGKQVIFELDPAVTSITFIAIDNSA